MFKEKLLTMKNKILFFLGFLIIFIIFILDMLYLFGNHDNPFIISAMLYIFLVMYKKISSKATFFFVLFFLFFMGASYIYRGPFRTTERIGEWFYIFFLIGMIQYAYESFFLYKNKK